jgi:hypothetical protein
MTDDEEFILNIEAGFLVRDVRLSDENPNFVEAYGGNLGPNIHDIVDEMNRVVRGGVEPMTPDEYRNAQAPSFRDLVAQSDAAKFVKNTLSFQEDDKYAGETGINSPNTSILSPDGGARTV